MPERALIPRNYRSFLIIKCEFYEIIKYRLASFIMRANAKSKHAQSLVECKLLGLRPRCVTINSQTTFLQTHWPLATWPVGKNSLSLSLCVSIPWPKMFIAWSPLSLQPADTKPIPIINLLTSIRPQSFRFALDTIVVDNKH